MNRRILGLGAATAAAGACALVLTPHGQAARGALASAGSDIPIWAFVVVGLALMFGLLFIILGSRRRRDDEEEVPDEGAPGEAHAAAESQGVVAEEPQGVVAEEPGATGSEAVPGEVVDPRKSDADPR